MIKPAKKKDRSLKKEVLGIIYFFMFVLFFVTLFLGLRFNLYSSIRNYKEGIKDLGNLTLSKLDMGYLEELFEETEKIYGSLPEDIKDDPHSDEYEESFEHLVDDRLYGQRKILLYCSDVTAISDIYLGFYDKENERMVFVLDGDDGDSFLMPGQYISKEDGEIEGWNEIRWIMRSTWYMSYKNSPSEGVSATVYLPLYGNDKKTIGIVGIDAEMKQFRNDILMYVVLFIPSMILLFFGLSRIISGVIEKRFIVPVKDLADAAREYTARDKVNGSEYIPTFEKQDVIAADELIELRNTMAEMEKDIHDSMQEIRRVSAEKERIAAELSIASQIQRSALPTRFPQSDKFDLYAFMDPAKEVAGDFYDFFVIDDDHLGIIIADVSGKGVPAALFMMKGKEILKNCAVKGGKPSEIMKNANEELTQDNENAMFITVWLGILEISTGILNAASAGHEYPFLMDTDGVFKKLDDPHGMVCGLVENSEYVDYTVTIPKGGGFFQYTDGIPEAVNKTEEYFGMKRLEESLNSHRGLSSKELIEAVKKDIDEFSMGTEQFDDITMVCLFMK